MEELGIYAAMSSTRAVRRLRPDPVPDVVLRRVLNAATWAPSGGNRQPWRVVVVRDAETKQRLGALYLARWRDYAASGRAQLGALPEASRALESSSLVRSRRASALVTSSVRRRT